jgi:DNA-binding IclR family transcriptional regulator
VIEAIPGAGHTGWDTAAVANSTRARASHREAAIRARIESTRTTGYAVNPALIVDGSWGMGAAVFDRSGRPAWALSLTGVETRFKADRRPELGPLLLELAHLLSGRLTTPGELRTPGHP